MYIFLAFLYFERILSKLFLMSDHNKLNFKAILIPIIISFILLIIKAYGWIITGSLSILSSLLDSTLDLIISLLNMVAIFYAAKPPDEDHRFGHNSIEDIVGLAQASFITASGLFILYEAIHRFFVPTQIIHHEAGILVMSISLVASLIIVIYQKLVFKKTKSVIVESDMMHYLTDFLINGAIIVSLLAMSKNRSSIIDPILASIIAFYIIYAAKNIGIKAFNALMDHELKPDEKLKIKTLIKSDPNIKGCHELKTRRSGSRIFMQLHIELDHKLSLKAGHDIADKLEKRIQNLWEQTEIIIHTDPV